MGLLIGITMLTGVCGLFLGAVCGVFFGGRSRQSEAVLLSFSAGAMLALVCFEFLHEALETEVPALLIAGVVLLGAAIVTFLDYVVDKRSGHSQDFITCENCDEEFEHDARHEHCAAHSHAHSHVQEHGHDQSHAHDHSHAQEHEHGHDHDGDGTACRKEAEVPHGSEAVQAEGAVHDSREEDGVHPEAAGHHHKKTSSLQLFVAGMVMAAAVAIHNLPEGMSIGAIYAGEGGVVSSALLMLLFSIVLHNIPEGMAISVPLMTGGMSRIRACAVAAVSGIPTVFGALLGYALGDMGEAGLALSLAFAAGTLLYVVFGEVLPQAINLYCSRKTAFAAILGVAAGMIILSGHVH